MADFEFADMDWFGTDDVQTIETARELPSLRTLKRAAKAKAIEAIKREQISEFLNVDTLPAPGEQLHIISNGEFDYFLFIPTIIEIAGTADECLGSTWTMSRANIQQLFELFDKGAIKKMGVLTGRDFKQRKLADASFLTLGMMARGQRYRAFRNHAKIILLAIGANRYVCESSANWTANPRLEQSLIANDAALYDFHKSWMTDFLEGE